MTAELPPVCHAPSCREEATLRFMRMTPLCARHGAKANRRAMVNVLVAGALFAVVGVLLLVLGLRVHPAIGATVAVSGGLVACLAPYYLWAARRLER